MTFQDIFKSSFLESFSSFSLTDTLLSLAAAFLIGLFTLYIGKHTAVSFIAVASTYPSLPYCW